MHITPLNKGFMKALLKLVAIMVIVGLVSLLFLNLEKNFQTPADFVEYINSFGALSPVIVILLITLEVVVAPIPGFLLAIAAGYAFGPVLGTVYTYIGNIIGSSLAFMISRRFGRPVAERLVKRSKLEQYDCFFKESGKIAIWVSFLFPLFPSDIVSFVSGLSTIRYTQFIKIVAIAYIPNLLILNYFGSQIFQKGFTNEIIYSASLVFFALFFGVIAYIYIRKKSARC